MFDETCLTPVEEMTPENNCALLQRIHEAVEPVGARREVDDSRVAETAGAGDVRREDRPGRCRVTESAVAAPRRLDCGATRFETHRSFML